jgi:hypothetical protein
MPTVSNTQFGVEDNVGGTAGTIASVNVTAGEALLVLAFNRQNAGQTATSATHGGSSLTVIDQSAGDGINVVAYGATGLSGSQTVTVNYSASTLWHMFAIRLASAHASAPFGTPSFNSGGAAGTAVSATVSSATGDLVISGVLVRDLLAASLAPDGGQTELLESTGAASYASSTSSEAGAASVTSGFTWTGGIESRIVVINIVASAAGTTMTPAQGPLTLTGTGLGLGFTINMPDEL